MGRGVINNFSIPLSVSWELLYKPDQREHKMRLVYETKNNHSAAFMLLQQVWI